jgi:hypothetical protein
MVKNRWYFVKLARLAVPWKHRKMRVPRGTSLKNYYLIQARSVKVALAKAEIILSITESRTGGARLGGHNERVDIRKVGVVDIEPLCEKLVSGVEIFIEAEKDVSMRSLRKEIVPARYIKRWENYEKKCGNQKLLDVFWGKEFDQM